MNPDNLPGKYQLKPCCAYECITQMVTLIAHRAFLLHIGRVYVLHCHNHIQDQNSSMFQIYSGSMYFNVLRTLKVGVLLSLSYSRTIFFWVFHVHSWSIFFIIPIRSHTTLTMVAWPTSMGVWSWVDSWIIVRVALWQWNCTVQTMFCTSS